MSLKSDLWKWLEAYNARYRAFAGGLHSATAPQGTAFPYLVVRSTLALPPDADTSSTVLQPRTLRFEVYATSEAQAEALRLTVQHWIFDETFKPPYLRSILKGADDLQQDPERDHTAQEVWQGLLDITFFCQEELGA